MERQEKRNEGREGGGNKEGEEAGGKGKGGDEKIMA